MSAHAILIATICGLLLLLVVSVRVARASVRVHERGKGGELARSFFLSFFLPRANAVNQDDDGARMGMEKLITVC